MTRLALAMILAATLGAPAPAQEIEASDDAQVQTGDGVQVRTGDNSPVTIGYTIEEHEAALARREAQLRADLDRAHTAEQDLLRLQLAEVERQRANLRESFEAREAELERLRARLSDLGAGIADERIEEAKQALADGDTTLADQLFAEVEAMEQASIDRAADAAFQRGTIAEDDIRWADAARHYAKAARLAPTYDRLFEARQLAWQSGELTRVAYFGQELLDLARADFGETAPEFATALNEHAITLQAMGRHAEAEPLFRQAVTVVRDTLGDDHPNTKIVAWNYASFLREHFADDPALAELEAEFGPNIGQ